MIQPAPHAFSREPNHPTSGYSSPPRHTTGFPIREHTPAASAQTTVQLGARRGRATHDRVARAQRPERGCYGSPAGFALPVTLGGKRCRVPAVADSKGRLQPLAWALELVNDCGGFEGKLLSGPRAEARLLVRGLSDVREMRRRLAAHKTELLGIGLDSLPPDERRLDAGALELVGPAPHALGTYLYLHASAPRGAATLRRIVRAIAPRLRSLTGADVDCDVHEVVGLRVQVRCTVHATLLARAPARCDRRQLLASVEGGLRRLDASLDAPRSAAKQNQSVLGAVSRVALALGHDPRRVLSDGHAHAARFGGCAPIVRFERRRSFVVGSLSLPLELGPHGQGRAPEARAARSLAQLEGGADLRLLAACVGLASQLPTLEAAIGEAVETLTPARRDP
jgi:hypothetical protein